MSSSFYDPRSYHSSKLIGTITLSLLALNQYIITFLRLSVSLPLPLARTALLLLGSLGRRVLSIALLIALLCY
jgi:hypothetical protein